jgi:hypothetical protein
VGGRDRGRASPVSTATWAAREARQFGMSTRIEPATIHPESEAGGTRGAHPSPRTINVISLLSCVRLSRPASPTRRSRAWMVHTHRKYRRVFGDTPRPGRALTRSPSDTVPDALLSDNTEANPSEPWAHPASTGRAYPPTRSGRVTTRHSMIRPDNGYRRDGGQRTRLRAKMPGEPSPHVTL